MDDPYLSGPYAPIDTEIDAEPIPVAGEVPRDLFGAYVRNGPNPRRPPIGLHHWFDGDAMLHAVHLEDGKLRYTNRYVRTPAMALEDEAGRSLWKGLMEPFGDNPNHAYKDTGNTDVIVHGGELLALWYVAGSAHRVDPRTLETHGEHRFGTERPMKLSAHSKVDERTGELLFFDYGPRPPFMSFGVVSPSGVLEHRTDIELPGPRLPHDMAFTERYAVLMDLPVFPRADALKQKKWQVDFHRDVPARFGVLPRRGEGAAIRWFEAEPCYVYHVVNAWEEDDSIVMIGCRCDDPIPDVRVEDGRYARAFANLRLDAHLHRWRFDLSTGRTHEESLDDRRAEFPSIDARACGRPSRFSYHMTIPDARTLFFDGIVKYDTTSGAAIAHHAFGDGVYGSEAPFAPRVGASEEDDGYLLTFVHDTRAERSELWIYDARAIERGPVARAAIPQRVPLGFHATWAPGDAIGAGS